MTWDGHQRRTTPRIQITLDLMLLREKGRGINARTLDLGPGGMKVSSERPLAIDEVVRFDLSSPGGEHIDGRARVLRMQGPNQYALRFEELDEHEKQLLTKAVGITG
jgi:c-di-GMP-binding flagellar brake protein YcgR